MVRPKLMCAAFLLALGSAASLFAAAPANAVPAAFRASTIEHLTVRNAAGDDLGKVKDLVIDAATGKVSYAALDFGGFLGVGDKLFAVPWHAFQYVGTSNDEHLVLDVAKEKLKNAPGFDKGHWPNMADPQWSREVDKFYGPPRTASR
jgi:sporulation protein YlmC with PRC-barrel domain